MSSVWRCRVCEGVNQGGRTCATCGTTVSRGEPLRAAVRTRIPTSAPPPPKPVPPTPRRRDLRSLPPPEMIEIESFEDYEDGGFEIVPLPGGCLITSGPRRRRRR